MEELRQKRVVQNLPFRYERVNGGFLA